MLFCFPLYPWMFELSCAQACAMLACTSQEEYSLPG